MSISVVIPHLNQAPSLRSCLASLRAQAGDVPTHEIIVVDNGSHELPTDVCNDAGVLLVSEPTPGPGPARNLGVARSSAPVLAFIDADCLAHPEWLASIHARFTDPAVEILGGDVRIARVDPERPTALEAYECVYAYRMKQYIEKQGFTGTGNLAVRRKVLEAVGPFGGLHIAEDLDWGQRSGKLGYRITYVPEQIVYHPARKTMDELYKKWDRHIAHMVEPVRARRFGWLRWVVYAAAVGASPLGEILRIARSDRISGMGERWLAFRALVVIRFYRCRKMLSLAVGRDSRAMSGAWNRD